MSNVQHFMKLVDNNIHSFMSKHNISKGL